MAKRKGTQVTVDNCSADGSGFFIVGYDKDGILHKFHSDTPAEQGSKVNAPVETR